MEKKVEIEGERRNAKRILELREAFHLAREISDLLRTGLDPEMLATCIRLIQDGVNPNVLARVITEMTRASELLDNSN